MPTQLLFSSNLIQVNFLTCTPTQTWHVAFLNVNWPIVDKSVDMRVILEENSSVVMSKRVELKICSSSRSIFSLLASRYLNSFWHFHKQTDEIVAVRLMYLYNLQSVEEERNLQSCHPRGVCLCVFYLQYLWKLDVYVCVRKHVQLPVFRESELTPSGGPSRPVGAPRPSVTHRALVWFLPCVSAHVNHQHVLSFEGLLLPRTVLPAAHKLLLLSVDVVIIDVLWDTHMQREMSGFLERVVH